MLTNAYKSTMLTNTYSAEADLMAGTETPGGGRGGGGGGCT